MLVGEAPGYFEERFRQPFVGSSGQELNRMLSEAGIMRSECFVTNVVRIRPPMNDLSHFIAMRKKDITPAHLPLRDRMVKQPVIDGFRLLVQEIELCQPRLVFAFGNVAMWALTGKWGIKNWRGSQLGVDTEEMKAWLPETKNENPMPSYLPPRGDPSPVGLAQHRGAGLEEGGEPG